MSQQLCRALGKALQTAGQYSDRHYQQQPTDAFWITHATALQLDDPRFVVANQLC
jgi:hypothetical protein